MLQRKLENKKKVLGLERNFLEKRVSDKPEIDKGVITRALSELNELLHKEATSEERHRFIKSFIPE